MEVELKERDYILDIAGPLGKPAESITGKKILTIGIMKGLVEVYPIAKHGSRRLVLLYFSRCTGTMLILGGFFEDFADKCIVDVF